MSKQSENRLNNPHMPLADMVKVLTGGVRGSEIALEEWCKTVDQEQFIMDILDFDTIPLYDQMIWRTYSETCGKDVEKFKIYVKAHALLSLAEL